MDVNAAIGYSQFKRLNNLIKIRSKNRLKIIKKLENSHKWDNQFEFFYSNTNVKPSFFGFPILINKKYLKRKKKFFKNVEFKKNRN